jgi:hypothetical protein
LGHGVKSAPTGFQELTKGQNRLTLSISSGVEIASIRLQSPSTPMSPRARTNLLSIQAGIIRSADGVVALWNRLPDERNHRPSDKIVLAIFAGAGAISIAGSLALMMAAPH